MRLGRFRVLSACLLLLAALCWPALALGRDIVVETTGGVRPGTRIIHVTTLADAGPGSLRDAVAVPGPRVVVFDVAGYIDMRRNLRITEPDLTIAGQTAPDPGVVLKRGRLLITASDVVVEHVGVYPGPAASPKANEGRDAITIRGDAGRSGPVRRVVLRNVSAGWGVDENVSVAGDDVGEVVIEYSLIAKALDRAGHPKGRHSCGLLVRPGARDVAIVGNIFANNDTRNPVIAAGDQIVLNNLVFGYGRLPLTLNNRDASFGPFRSTIVGNVFVPNADTRCRKEIFRFGGFGEGSAEAAIFAQDNVVDQSLASPSCPFAQTVQLDRRPFMTDRPPLAYPDWRQMPSREVYGTLLDHAGMRPAARPPIDAAIIAGIEDRSGRIIDLPKEDGGWLPMTPASGRPEPPGDGAQINDPGEVDELARWLCERHVAVGGIAYEACEPPS